MLSGMNGRVAEGGSFVFCCGVVRWDEEGMEREGGWF